MRTRFLNNDYFTLPPSQRRETLSFLHLPVPRLPPPTPSAALHHLRFDPPIHLSNHIDPFPIGAALSTFLSAVLPHRIHVEVSSPSPNPNREQEAEVIFEDHVSKSDIEFREESKTIALSDKNGAVYETIQFETPQLDPLHENVCFAEEERMQMLSPTPEVENSLEMLKPDPSRQYPYEALESVSSVKDIISEYVSAENSYCLEDHIFVQRPPHSDHNKFLILELEEESLGIPTCISLQEIVSSYFENTRPQNYDELYQSLTEGKGLLGSTKNDMMEFFSDDCVSKKSLVLADSFPERDFMDMLETEHIDGNAAMQGTLLADSALLLNLVTFQEFVFLDDDVIQTFDAFYDTKASNDLLNIDWMLREFKFKSFDELIVSNEIALTDDTFKSLPVPVISDHIKMIALHDIVVELFSNLKIRPLSASDGIYLNWDLLEEDKCNYKISNWYRNILTKVDLNNQYFGGKSFDDGQLVFDLVFSCDTISDDDIKQSEELQKLLLDSIPLLENRPVELASGKPLEPGSSKQGSGEQLPERNAERASLLFMSMPEISNLDYFLNPQKATVKGNCNSEVELTNANVGIPKVTSTRVKTDLQSRECHTVLHRVQLSYNIVALARYFEKGYLAILHSDTELTKMPNLDADYLKLLSIPKHKLIEYHVNENNMAFIVLSAIKQAAWYLCFYGLHPASLYLEKLCQNMDYLKSRLGFLQSLIKEEERKVDNNITMSHPSLTNAKGILQSSIKRDSLKALIVAEEVYWRSMKKLLLALGLSFSELNDSYRSKPYANNVPQDTDTKLKELLISNCLLVSYKHVSPLFPFNKFDIILEYGGPYGSSRISELSPNSVGFPHLHFLMVELDGHAAIRALCEGVEMCPDTEMLMESESRLIFNHKESMTNKKLERLLNFCPVEQSYDMKPSKLAPEADNLVPLIPAVKTEHECDSVEPCPGTVIIVNTQNVEKEMIMSRRISYQAILALEKGGIQVVERDLHLPVDIILSSAICLAWYDSRNLGKKATPATEASSSLPLCIDNIATDVLTLLSFYFRGCFLVFEGEFNFLSTVMECSDGLYAAAASLGIDLQIFFSYSPELTNEVIVSCIKSATSVTRGLYPKMPDSVTLAESFLTECPGINPLTAHSILSSGVKLNEFLEWSHEQRMQVLERYHVPEESISLFSVFCRYGEREDSKSIMTDCSSSVSSGLDSDRCRLYQVDNERRRKHPISGHQKDEPCFDELLHFETLNEVIDVVSEPSSLPKKFDLGMSIDARRSSDLAKASFSVDDFFDQKQSIGATAMRNLSRVSLSPRNCKGVKMSEQLRQPSSSLKNKELAQTETLDAALMSKSLNWHSLRNSEKLHEDTRGEVVDFTDSLFLDKNFPDFDSTYFTSLMTETGQEHIRKDKIARRLSFGNSCHPQTNPSKTRTSLKDTREVDDYPEPDFEKDMFPLDFKPRENSSLTQASMRNLQEELPFQEEMSYLSETPLSLARRSASILKNSPWTTDFINKVKEKSKLRQKSLSNEISKKKSPSVIELFKYQPNRTSQQQKRRNHSGQSSNSAKKGRYSTSRSSSCTPNDKRSTKILTFGRNGSGGQTRLVWSDK